MRADTVRSVACAVLAAVAVRGAVAAEPLVKFVAQPACSSLPAGTVEYSDVGLLSDEEPREKWRLLFDGTSLKGWSGFERNTIPPAWRVEEGALMLPKFSGQMPSNDRGDIRTVDVFKEFELRLQWAIAPGGNSGIFFFVREGIAERIWHVAPEMQILDDSRHEDGVQTARRAGALYDVYAPKCNALKPAGEYNDVRLIVRQGRVEHWLNGYRVAEYTLGSQDFRSRVARSKFKDMKEFARVHSGHLALQDHGDEIRFRRMRIREL